MSGEERLYEIVTSLENVGVSCLVMGGHAVRFYGLARNTNDFDMKISTENWGDLAERLRASPLGASESFVEGPSCRAHSFRRFRIGLLETGQDEWLEFWRDNHLLAPHWELLSRAERGRYGNRDIAFLGLADLIRSKETEREADWTDVSSLEDFLDSRFLARAKKGEVELAVALANLRSRAGFGGYFRYGAFDDNAAVTQALAMTSNPITQVFLLPYLPGAKLSTDSLFAIEPVIAEKLAQLAGGSTMHLSLVEVVRRRYIQFRKDLDRRDKEAIRATLSADQG